MQRSGLVDRLGSWSARNRCPRDGFDAEYASEVEAWVGKNTRKGKSKGKGSHVHTQRERGRERERGTSSSRGNPELSLFTELHVVQVVPPSSCARCQSSLWSPIGGP